MSYSEEQKKELSLEGLGRVVKALRPNTPSTGIPKRIGSIYNRRPSTPWSEKEVAAYKKLVKAGYFNDPADLELVTLYYQTERKKERGIHRRDLLTFLNNFPGELDRAREWREKVKKRPRGYGTFNKDLGPATDEDFKVAGLEAKKLIESLRTKLRPNDGEERRRE